MNLSIIRAPSSGQTMIFSYLRIYFELDLRDEQETIITCFAYIGSRTTGNDGGSFLVTGPGWKGEKPNGIKMVIQSETEIVPPIYRTQLFNPGDLDDVKTVQAGYKVQILSRFLGKPTIKAPMLMADD